MNKHRARIALVLLAGLLLLSGCNRARQQAQQVAAQAAAAEQAAKKGESDFEDAVGKQNWHLAKAQADVLISRYPDTQAARRVRARFDAVKTKADAQRELARTAALWSYNSEPVAGHGKAGGIQLSAAIDATDPVDVDGSGARPVQLVFRDHPSWGRSAYVVLQAGDFDCYSGCKVKVTVDGGTAKSMAGSRPKTDEAIAMFIEDEGQLWHMIQNAKVLSLEFPVKAGGTRSVQFEVGGLDASRMPGWKRAS